MDRARASPRFLDSRGAGREGIGASFTRGEQVPSLEDRALGPSAHRAQPPQGLSCPAVINRARDTLMTDGLLASNIQIVRHAGVFVAEWPPVPPEAVSWMLPELDSLAHDVTAAILREVPEYRRPDDDSYAKVVYHVAR